MTASAPKSGWRSAIWLGADRAGLVLGSLISQAVIVRYLGPSVFGELSFVLAWVSILIPIAQAGTGSWIVRALLEKPSDEWPILKSAMTLRLVGSLIGILSGVSLWLILESDRGHSMMVLLLFVAQVCTVFQVADFYFQSTMDSSSLVRVRLGVVLLFALLKCVVAINQAGIDLLIGLYAVEAVALGLAGMWSYFQAQGRVLRPGLGSPWVDWFRVRSGWLMASSLAEVIYLKIDIIMLERMRGIEEVGTYSVAARLSEVWYAVPVLIMAAWFPRIWESRSSENDWNAAIQRSLDGLLALALLLAIVMQLAAGFVVTTIFGSEVAGSAAILTVHIWASIFIFMRAVFSRWLIAEDLPRFSLITHVAGAVMNVALNLWWIPTHGALGAAYATLVSYAFASWITLYLHPRTRPMAHMMARSICLPLRWSALRAYWNEWRRSA